MNKNLLIEKNKIIIKLLYIIMIFNFVITQQIREGLFGYLGKVNIIATITLLYIVIRYFKKFNIKYIFIVFTTNFYLIFSSSFYENSSKDIILSVLSFTAPLLIIGLTINKIDFKKLFKEFLKIFNKMIILITIIGIFDMVFDYKVILYICKILPERIEELILIEQISPIYRLFSIYGHPLLNVEMYLMFYILNMLGSRYLELNVKLNIITIISFIGIAMTASKSGLILLIIMMIFINRGTNKSGHYLKIIILFIIALTTGIFDTTINRFLGGSLTTGRSETWQIIKDLNLYPFKFFTGYGRGTVFEYNNLVHGASAAFEYPIRMFSLEIGILATILIYLSIMIYPIYIIAKRRQWIILMSYMVIFIDINTYNGIALLGDYIFIFSIFTFLILNISNYIAKEKYVEI